MDTASETAAVPPTVETLVDPYQPIQYTDEAGQPIKLNRQEQADYRKAAGLVDPLLDLPSEDLFFLARNPVDPERPLNILSAWMARKDELSQDPDAVQRVADAWDKYKASTGLKDLPNLPELLSNAAGFAKGAVTQAGTILWNYPQRPFVSGAREAEVNRNLAEASAASEAGLAGLGHLAERLVGKVAGIFGGEDTPQTRVQKLFADTDRADQLKEIVTGEGRMLPKETSDKLKAAGFPVRPEEVEKMAAGDLLTLYLFGKTFGAAGKIIPGVVSGVTARAIKSFGTQTAVVGGRAIEMTGAAAQKVLPKAAAVAPVAGAIKGAAVGSGGGSLWGGAALGYAAGKIAAKRLMKAVPQAKAVEEAGKQIAGKEITAGVPMLPSNAYTQLAKDLLESAPAAAYEVGKGAAFDIGFAGTAETPEEAKGVGVGALFGLVGAGARTGGHVLSGQLIAPRGGTGIKGYVRDNGIAPELESVHRQSYNEAPPGVQQRVNALREFFKAVFPDHEFIYAAKPEAGKPDPLIAKLRSLGLSEEDAQAWAGQSGGSLKIGDKKIILEREVGAAPHEGGHALEDVLGESAMRALDRMVQADPQYVKNWEAIAQSYAAAMRDASGKRLWNPMQETWQDFILRQSKWGPINAAEKLVGQEGMGPHPQGRAEQLWNDAVAKADGATPEEKSLNAWKSILTPEEQAEVANRYISREVLAENFDAMLKHSGGFALADNSIPARLARVIGTMISYVGGEPLAGRVSEFRRYPLSYELTKFQQKAVTGLAGGKPAEAPPTPKRRGVFGPPATPADQQDAEARAKEYIAEASDKAPEPGAQSPKEVMSTLAEAMAGQNAVVIEGRAAAPGDPSSAQASNRAVRRAIIEVWRFMPDSAKTLVQKLFFPTRIIKTKTGTYQAEGWSPEVLAANAQKAANFFSRPEILAENIKLPDGIVLDPGTASFTPESWKLLFDNIDTFAANQRSGRTGSGEPLVVPKEVTETGGYAPPVRGEAKYIPQEMADFINYLYNFKIPDTAIIRGERVPLNVQAQRVAEATIPGRVAPPVEPRGVFGEYGKTAKTQEKQQQRAEDLGIAGIPVQETNPFRNTVETAAKAAGVEPPSLFEVIQHLNVDGIKKVEHAPEQGPKIPANTLTLSAGFQPGRVNAEPATPLPKLDPEKIRGGAVSAPHPIYRDAATQEGNPWVRRDASPDNTDRTLLVQISSNLINPESLAGVKDEATRYYDKLYSGARPGYARLQDFWEIPQWIGFASHFIPKSDVYVVRDLATAKRFLNEAEYGRVAFSALDTNKALIRDLVKDYPGHVDVGGYVDPATFSDLPNVKWHDTMASLADDMGIPYSEGVDYSHFQGSDVIPRLTMSKGCRHKCAFCAVPKVVEETPAEVITQQADAIARLGSKLVYLNDKTFGQAKNYKMLSDVNRQIKELNPDFQGFIIQTTAAQLKVIPAEWLKDSGIKFVELGIESYNDPILKEMHKPATESLINQVTDKLRQNGIALIPNIIIGFLSETPETYARTMTFLRDNKDIISHANIYNFALYKNTELGKKITTASDADFNENVLEKSFHTNPEVHRQFAGDVYGLAERMLEGKPESAQFQAPKELPENVSRIDDLPETREELFKTSAVSDLLDKITTLPADEWTAWAKTGKGMSQAAHDTGMAVRTPEELAQLRATYDSFNNLASLALKNGNIEQAAVLGNKAQAANEAYASATGKDVLGRDFESVLRQLHGQDYRPPMPGGKPAAPTLIGGQFSPSADPRAIRAAAVREREGKRRIFTGVFHGAAYENALEQGGPWGGKHYEEGFIDGNGNFLTRLEAQQRAKETGQLMEETISPLAKTKGIGIEDLTMESLMKPEWGTPVQFQPSKDKRAIKSAAVRVAGRVFEGPVHAYAIEEAQKALGAKALWENEIEDGFTTHSDEFLNRQAAYKRAADLKQIDESEYAKAVEDRGQTPALMIDEPMESLAFRAARQFLPSKDPKAIKKAAIRNDDTKEVFTGPMHAEAWLKAEKAKATINQFNWTEGFVTGEDEFLNRDEAAQRAFELGQTSRRLPYMESMVFYGEQRKQRGERGGVQFLPRERTDEWKLREAGRGNMFSKAWITPRGTPIQLGPTWHHAYFDQNPDVRRRYGLPKSSGAEDNRIAAMKRGFARINYNISNGQLTVEARNKDWPDLIPSIRQFVEANSGKIDSISVNLFNAAADKVIRDDFEYLFKYSAEEKQRHLPFITAPERGPIEMSAQASSAQAQPPMFPSETFDKELKKIRTGESGGQTFFPSGEVWTPENKKVDLVSLASVNVPLGKLNRATLERVLAKLADLLEEKDLVAGVYAFSKDGKPTVSVDLNAVVPKAYRKNTLAFAKDNDQIAIWDAEASKEIPAGGKGDTKLQSPGEILDALNSLTRGEPVDVQEIIRENRVSEPIGEELSLPGMTGKKTLAPATVSEMTKADIAAYYPESVIPRRRNEPIPSEIVNSPLYKEAGGEEEAILAFSRKLVEFAKEWQDHPSYQSGLRWYSEFAPMLNRVMGKDAPIFAELLAGTSPQQPPGPNFAMALDALEGFKAGRFAKNVELFEKGLEKIKDGSWRQWIAREIKAGRVVNPPESPTAETFIKQWVKKYDILPRQSNGKLYSISSEAVLRVLARRWLRETAGLKTQNFVQNLLGTGHEATIDLWADRTMRRIGYSGFKDRWRILPKNATGVSDADFLFSQKAFRAAAEQLGVLPDSLQGGLWFAEKQLWADNGWSRLDLGDFRKEMPKLGMLRKGIEQRTATQQAASKARPAAQPELIIEPRNLRQ